MKSSRGVFDISLKVKDVTLDESREQGDIDAQPVPIPQRLGGLALEIERELEADVVVYSGGIGSPADVNFRNIINQYSKNDHVILWVSTYGGIPDSAYRMGKALQNAYSRVTVFVDGYCKSSGTLLALCANEIWMTDSGEFGPLDIQLMNKEEYYERNSGLDSFQALSTLAERSNELMRTQFMDLRMGARLSTKQALEAATKVTIGLLSPIYEQLEPMRLGEVSRSMEIAFEYGKRLNKGILKHGAIEHLIAKYPSHSYVVDRSEAEDRLFNNVKEPHELLLDLTDILGQFVAERISGSEPLLLHLNQFLPAESLGDEQTSHSDHDCGASEGLTIEDHPKPESEDDVDGVDDADQVEEQAGDTTDDEGEHHEGEVTALKV